MRSKWWLIALALGCRSSTEPEQSAIADLSGRVLSKANVAVPASRVEVHCEEGKVTAESVTSSNGVYALAVVLPAAAQTAADTATCEFVSPSFEGARYWAQADITLYSPGFPHPLQVVDLHELP